MEKTQESGHRVKITCNIVLSGLDYESTIIKALEKGLIARFGGFTRIPFYGGWKDESGKIMLDSGNVYEVSFPISETSIKDAITLFSETGKALGEQWIHIEQSFFIAKHRKVN